MTDRLASGSRQLDIVLGGGLPREAICAVIGPPGSGKTILAQQCVFANATPERPALYFSTVSEPLAKILRFAQTLSFFDPTAVGRSVWYDDLGSILHDQGLAGTLNRVRELIRDRWPALVVIDSFRALHPYADRTVGFRPFLHDLSGMLSAFPATSLWVGEYQEDDIHRAAEFAVADAIIALGTVQTGERAARSLQVHKLRGGSFLSGRHAYRLTEDGLVVYPRLADPSEGLAYDIADRRVSSGIQALDEMLKDGYWSGASTLVAGPTGIGKTLMGLHFVFHAVAGGERAIIATTQEDPSQLERVARQFGWDVSSDRLTVMYRSPVDLDVDQCVHALLDMIEATGASRVLVDSLGDLQAAAADDARFREYLYSLLHRSSRRGTSVMLTYEVSELTGVNRLSDAAMSQLADNVVLLEYGQLGEAMTRYLTVLKTRAADHQSGSREFRITDDGLLLAPTLGSSSATE